MSKPNGKPVPTKKVVATSLGFHPVSGARLRPGTVFDMPADASAFWFKDVEPEAPRDRGRPVPTALSQMGKDAPQSFTAVMGKPSELV